MVCCAVMPDTLLKIHFLQADQMSRKRKPKSKAPTSVIEAPAETSTPLQSPDIAEWLKEGLTLHQSGKLNEAKLIYEQILQEQSNHFDALQLLATVYAQQKNSLIALTYFDKALQVNQANAVVFNNRGHALKDLKRLDEALKNYDEAIRLKPDYAEALNNRNALLDLKRMEEAVGAG